MTWWLTRSAGLPRRAVTAAAVVVAASAGVGVERAAGGRGIAIGGLAVLVAAANGLAKAYSP